MFQKNGDAKERMTLCVWNETPSEDLRMTSPSEVSSNGGNAEEGNGEEALVLGRDQGTSEPSQSSFGCLFFLFWFLFSISQ